MNLSENGFAILGVSPADDREMLTTKADDAALLLGKNGEEAFNNLTQMKRRIIDEISWFPGTPSMVADTFLEYSRKISAGETAEVPDMEGLGTPLAQANALQTFFEHWPADDPELLIGLCRSVDMILSGITVEETCQAINADREAGKWEIIRDVQEITEPLNLHLRELCAPIVKAADKMDQESLSRVICNLSRDRSVDLQGDVLQELRQVYEIRNHEEEERLRNEITALFDKMPKGPRIFTENAHLEKLRKATTAWFNLTLPLQFVPGPARKEALKTGIAIRDYLIQFIDNAPAETKVKTFHKGNRSVTMTYKTKRKTFNKVSEMAEWAKDLFLTGDNEDLISAFREFEKVLRAAEEMEEEQLAKAEKEARDRLRY